MLVLEIFLDLIFREEIRVMFKKGTKKFVGMLLVVIAVTALSLGPALAAHSPSWNQSYGKDRRTVDHQKTAMWMSMMLPGTGEWYNRDFEGSFPWVECILGYICCFFKLSSFFDAADGIDNDKFRFDFWTSPQQAYKR